jgi:cytoskeleton protein RodZ
MAARRADALLVPLALAFAEESWVEITDARGERLYFGLGAAGDRAALQGEPPFAVVLGNANGVSMTLDGNSYPIPTNGREGSLARFTVDIIEE